MIPCAAHGDRHCFLQANGVHVPEHRCTCAAGRPDAGCPVSVHRARARLVAPAPPGALRARAFHLADANGCGPS